MANSNNNSTLIWVALGLGALYLYSKGKLTLPILTPATPVIGSLVNTPKGTFVIDPTGTLQPTGGVRVIPPADGSSCQVAAYLDYLGNLVPAQTGRFNANIGLCEPVAPRND